MKNNLKSSSISINNLSEKHEVIIDGINIQKRYYKEEISKIQENLIVLLEEKIYSLIIKNITIEESKKMDFIMQKIGKVVNSFKIENSYIGNLDLYMSSISGKIGKNYSLSEKQYINKFEYNRENEMLVIAGKNLDILSEINRYKKPKLLKIEIYSRNDLKNLIKYIDVIRELKLSRNILVDKSKEQISEIYRYENYINEKVILFQSDLIKESLGLDMLPTKKINQTIYNLKIDGSKVDKNCIYIVDKDQEKLFIKDMQDISKYINVAEIEYKNVIFSDKYEVKQVISEVESSKIMKKLVEDFVDKEHEIVKKSMFDILKEKLFKILNIKFRGDKKQKAFPI